jgi:hypothetical protein
VGRPKADIENGGGDGEMKKYVRFNFPRGVVIFVPTSPGEPSEYSKEQQNREKCACFDLKRSIWEAFRYVPFMKYVDGFEEVMERSEFELDEEDREGSK